MLPFILYVCVALTLNLGVQDTPTKVLAKFSVLIFCYLCSIFFYYFKINFLEPVAFYFERFEEYPVIFLH